MIITRPFECKEDHSKCTQFAVVGKTHQEVYILPIRFMVKDNLTPHLISFIRPYKEDPVPVTLCCSVIGCGLTRFTDDAGNLKIRLENAKNILMPSKTLEALESFTDTGYEIG